MLYEALCNMAFAQRAEGRCQAARSSALQALALTAYQPGAAPQPAFKAEMDKAGADYRFVSLPGARHGFTNPGADAHQAHGVDVAYNKEADERSWADMQAFFKDVFQR